MNQDNNEIQTDEEIYNDFNHPTTEVDKNNFDYDNEVTDYLQYSITESKIEEETNGISILKELEDKWDNIEKQMILNKQSANHKKKKITNIQKINYKEIIDNMKNNFLNKVRIARAKYNNNIDFELYAIDTINKMEKKITIYEQIKNELINSTSKRDNNKNTNMNVIQSHSNEHKIKKQSKEKQNKPKTFLLPETPRNPNQIKIKSIQYNKNKNPFNCTPSNSIENLVYESPNYNTPNINNENYEYNYAISTSLSNKLKNVFNYITQPLMLFQSNYKSKSNIDKELQLNDTNPIEVQLNQNKINNKDNYDSLYLLEKNFDNFVSKINPSLNNRIEKKMLINHNEIKEKEIFKEQDIYFEKLKEVAGLKKQNSNNTIKENKFTLMFENADAKFLKKMEENVKLLNNVMKKEEYNKRKNLRNYSNSKIKLIKYNAPLLRNHSRSLLNNTNSSSLMQDNRIVAKNKFDDTLNKLYDINFLKIHKLIKSK